MKIELKRITYNARLSDETSAYAADIYIDGVKRGTTQNDGQGGMDLIRPHELRAEIDEYAKTLPPLQGHLSLDAELLFGELLVKHLEAKRLKRLLAKKTVYYLDGKVWSGGAPKPDAVVLNSLPFNQALQLFLATA